jgi:transcriptional regulator
MEILQGTLDLLVLQTLDTMGSMHGWGIARRLEQVSQDRVNLNYGTLYPALIRLEQKGWIRSAWGTSENNRRAKFYSLTNQGHRQLTAEKKSWQQITAFVSRVLGES